MQKSRCPLGMIIRRIIFKIVLTNIRRIIFKILLINIRRIIFKIFLTNIKVGFPINPSVFLPFVLNISSPEYRRTGLIRFAL